MSVTRRPKASDRTLEEKLQDPPVLPEPVEIPLERGAMLWIRPLLDGRWMADVRWPSPAEKDPLLAAGGYRTGIAETVKLAEKLGRALFQEGTKPEARMRA